MHMDPDDLGTGACHCSNLVSTVEPLLYDHPQNHIDVVV